MNYNMNEVYNFEQDMLFNTVNSASDAEVLAEDYDNSHAKVLYDVPEIKTNQAILGAFTEGFSFLMRNNDEQLLYSLFGLESFDVYLDRKEEKEDQLNRLKRQRYLDRV